MPRKATVKFIHEDGREVSADVTVNDDQTLDLQMDFGEEGEAGHVGELHHNLSVVLFNALTGMGEPSGE